MYGKKAENFYTDCYQYVNSTVAYLESFKKQNKEFKEKQKRNFDKSHTVKSQPQIPVDTRVWITSEREKIPGRVVANAGTPRSYVVETSRGEIERNRKHLNVDPSQADQSSTSYQQEEVARNSPKVGQGQALMFVLQKDFKEREMWHNLYCH